MSITIQPSYCKTHVNTLSDVAFNATSDSASQSSCTFKLHLELMIMMLVMKGFFLELRVMHTKETNKEAI